MRDSRNSVTAPGSSGNQRMRYSHAGAPSHAHAMCSISGRIPNSLRDVRVEAGRPQAVARGRARTPSTNRSSTIHSDGPTAWPASAMTGARLAPPDSEIISSSASGEPSDCSMLVISGIVGSERPLLAALARATSASERSLR